MKCIFLSISLGFLLFLQTSISQTIHPQIALNSSQSGVVSSSDYSNTHVLELPPNTSFLSISVASPSNDVDLAIAIGQEGNPSNDIGLNYIDKTPSEFPEYLVANPVAGTYYIYVINAFDIDMPYTIFTSTAPKKILDLSNSCIYFNDSECDEPIIGSGLCATGTDRIDCAPFDHLANQGPITTNPTVITTPTEITTTPDVTTTPISTSNSGSTTSPYPNIGSLSCEHRADQDPLANLGVGETVHLSCPSNCPNTGRLWGTDIHTDDSSICLAAHHGGLIADAGGDVYLTILDGQSSYVASDQNGVRSNVYGSWDRSFRLNSVNVSTNTSFEQILSAEWFLNANGYIGTLTLSQNGSQWQGTLNLGNGLESISNIIVSEPQLQFERPLGANTQHYNGELSFTGDIAQLTGSFSQDSTGTDSFAYQWSAERPYQQPSSVPSSGVSNPPTQTTGTVATAPAQSSSSIVSSDQSATLNHPLGASIHVPSGAVALADDGSIGQVTFSIENATDNATLPSPSLPSHSIVAGQLFQLGPEGLELEQPVSVTLPIADDIDPSRVYGVTTYDANEGIWITIPGIVDEAARTITFKTSHFSPFAPVAWWNDDSWNRENGGWLNITNNEREGSGYPCNEDDSEGCRSGMSASHGYGICLTQWTLEQPNLRFWSLRDDSSRIASAPDGETIRWWLPNGTYTIEEFYHISQINRDPLYVPKHKMYLRLPRTIQINAGNTIELGANYPQGYAAGWSTCHGGEGIGSGRRKITSYGTGDVQVTLTWQGNVDVDLYVTDPLDETIYYGEDSSSSGGKLDRDNKCGDSVLGGPENIFWPTGGAPNGNYAVSVDYYGYCGEADAPTVNWTVRVVVAEDSTTFRGTLAPGENKAVTTFTNITSTEHTSGTSPESAVSQDPQDDACWASYSDDPRSFSTQPGNVGPHITLTEAGSYMIHIGGSGEYGLPTKPDTWTSYGPFTIQLGANYSAVMQASRLSWTKNGARLAFYNTYPNEATIFTRNDNLDQFWSMCVQKLP